ncbi:androgen-induced gene 1 protein [Drosophila innubila]|uniref:androgen-induced gene 1 protein n=1 Tax=Drosophila innubila TaxID=198719 RepID=UPI00148DB316|nr:androgen-induced gene 1 protein [Drosophila innubila]
MKKRSRWLPCRFLLHVVATLNLGYAVYYDYKYAELPAMAMELRMVTPLGGKFKYLTFLNGLLQTGYYMLALGYDLYPLPGLRQLRDYLLASFVVPLGLTVSITFWTLCGVYGESIYLDFLDHIYPGWLNHTMHTLVVVYALLEICLVPHQYPQRNRGFTGVAIVMGCYLVWLNLVHYWTGIWIYPFLSALLIPQRWFFFALVVGLSFVYYLLGEQLNYALWAQ